jgi:hypothetical protein
MRGLTDVVSIGFLHAIRGNFDNFGGAFAIEELVSTPWASVTFSGARHRVTFTLEGEGAAGAADAFLARMDEAEFDLGGHILADIAWAGEERDDDGRRVRLTLEALTVKDD